MTVLEIEGRKVEVSDDFLSMSPEQQAATVDEISQGMNISPNDDLHRGFFAQANQSIADGLQAISPFNAIRQGAKSALGSPVLGEPNVSYKQAFRDFGIPTANVPPDGIVENAGRGAGSASLALIPAAGASGVLARSSSPLVANIADDVYRGILSLTGAGAEVAAGAVSGAAGEFAREQGAPEFVANMAEVAAPIAGLPLAAGAARLATGGTTAAVDKAVSVTPVAGTLMRAGKRAATEFKRGFTPMTEGGAMEVARKRVHDAVGGADRAADINQRITRDNPLDLTPAQQSSDPDLMGLERAAMDESPGLRDKVLKREAASRDAATSEIKSLGGSSDEGRKFFTKRRAQFGGAIQDRVDRVLSTSDEVLDGVGPKRAKSTNSERVVTGLKHELEAHLGVEARLWSAVPKEAAIPTRNAADAAHAVVSSTPRAQQEDIPTVAKELLLGKDGLGSETTVAELHGLYSKLREIARTARAGTNQQRNKARIANEIADAILKDLGAVDGTTAAGRAINDARAFSAELHKKFDQGTVGRILNRTIDGDERIAPETALTKTVGRGREDALVASRDIQTAAPRTSANIADSLRGDFADAIFSPDGNFSEKRARAWLRNNREVLTKQHPKLFQEMAKALKGRTQASAFAARAKVRAKLDDASPSGRIANGSPEKAVATIISAADPINEARRIINTARKDKTGKALASVKGAFTDFLIGKANTKVGLSGEELFGVIVDPKVNSALRQVFSGKEFVNITRIARELRKLDAPRSNMSQVLNSPANQLLEKMVRIAAVRATGKLNSGGAGESLQVANMASGTAKRFLQNLTNDRARQILVDAIEDPELMKVLLASKTPNLSKRDERILSRYLVGATGAAIDRE